MKRRILSALTAGALAVSIMTPALAANDLDGHWSQAAMNTWMEYGIIQGYNDGSVQPDKSITRGELAVMLDRVMEYQSMAKNNFTDLDNSWYTDAILGANAAGVITGYTDGTVKPEATITRQEAVVMFARVLGLDTESAPAANFLDQDEIASWAEGAVNAMVSKGYIQGSNGSFRPNAGITRAEVVTILNNVFATLYQEAGEYTDDVNGSAVISADEVTLKDMTVSNDLIIAEGVGDGHVVLDGVTVEGTLLIRGGGENSVIIKGDSEIDSVVVARRDGTVRVSVEGAAAVDTVVVDDGSDAVLIEGTVDKVLVEGSGAEVEVTGTVEAVSVAETTADATVTIAKGASVDTLTTAAKNTTLSVAGQVTKVEIGEKAADATIKTESSAKVDSLTTAADNTTVEGNGTVSKVEVGENATGATVNTSGTKVENNSSESVTTPNGSISAGENGTTSSGSSGGSSGGSGGGSSTPSHTSSVLSTDIGEKEFYVGVPVEFTFTTTANDDAGISVIGTSNFSDTEAISKLEYYEVQNGQWYELNGDFGPSSGFPMADATSRFRVTFAQAGEYTFTASMKRADNEKVLCSTEVTFSVAESLPETATVVSNETELTEALSGTADTIYLDDNFSVDSKVTVNRPVTIEGSGYTITAADWSGSSSSDKHLLGIEDDDVTIRSLTLDSANAAYGVQAYRAANSVLEDVTLKNSKGSGLTVNGSSLTANNLSISGSAWLQSIDLTMGNGVTDPAVLTLDSAANLTDATPIVEDGACQATVTVGGIRWYAAGAVMVDSDDVSKNYIKYAYSADVTEENHGWVSIDESTALFGVDNAWKTDRAEPASFTYADGQYQLTVDNSTYNSASFYMTQGRKITLNENSTSWTVSAEVYLTEEMLSGEAPYRTELWLGTTDPTSGSVNAYPIVGAYQNEGNDTWRWWNSDGEGLWTEVDSEVSAPSAEWHTLTISCDGSHVISYSIDGTLLASYEFGEEGDETVVKEIMLQVYNYSESAEDDYTFTGSFRNVRYLAGI